MNRDNEHVQNVSQVSDAARTQKMLILFWNLKVYYCIYKSLPLVPILSQMNSIHTLIPYFC